VADKNLEVSKGSEIGDPPPIESIEEEVKEAQPSSVI
jgi:hypothetical protein